jgi:hypothetical protein
VLNVGDANVVAEFVRHRLVGFFLIERVDNLDDMTMISSS